jgi:hypothetical protein
MNSPASPEDIQAAAHAVLQSRLDDLVQEVIRRLDAPASPVAPSPDRPSAEDADPAQAVEAAAPLAIPSPHENPPPPANEALAEAREALAQELTALEKQLEEKRREIEAAAGEAANARQRAEKEMLDAETRARDAAAALQAQITPLKKELEELKGQLAEDKKTVTEAAQVRLDKEQIVRDAAALAAQREKYEDYNREVQKTRLLLERVWPRWLHHPSLTTWRQRLETQLSAPTVTPSLGLLFAALHGCAAASRDNSDPKTLYDALREVGRRLYASLREDDENASESDCAHVAEQWAQAINVEYAGRGEVEAPLPGSAANSQWMTFQPRGGSSPDILSVRSWCVRDAQKRPVHRAEVIV